MAASAFDLLIWIAGGAAFLFYTSATFVRSVFERNTAQNGGALFGWKSNVHLIDSNFTQVIASAATWCVF